MPDRNPELLHRASTALVVVDVQERFRPHIYGFERMLVDTDLLIRGCLELGVPIAVSEQYPEGLGKTVTEVERALDAAHDVDGSLVWRMEKLEISTAAASSWADAPPQISRADSIVVCGIETHVCVSQTVLDLLHAGRRVHVVADGVGSRDPWQREIALERLARAGATISSVETVLFELLGRAGTPEFKAVQRLIKEHDRAVEETP